MPKLSEGELMRITTKAWDHPYSCDCNICGIAWVMVGPDGGEAGNFGPFNEDQIRKIAAEIEQPFPEGCEDGLGDEHEPAF